MNENQGFEPKREPDPKYYPPDASQGLAEFYGRSETMSN
jgi:hypothetical protein